MNDEINMPEDGFEEAIRWYNAGRPHDPFCAEYDRALAAAAQIGEDDPRAASLLNTVWHIHYLRGQLDAALADLDRALALSPESAHIHYNRGVLNQRRGAMGEAVGDFRRARELAIASDDDDTVDAVDHHLAELDA